MKNEEVYLNLNEAKETEWFKLAKKWPHATSKTKRKYQELDGFITINREQTAQGFVDSYTDNLNQYLSVFKVICVPIKNGPYLDAGALSVQIDGRPNKVR